MTQASPASHSLKGGFSYVHLYVYMTHSINERCIRHCDLAISEDRRAKYERFGFEIPLQLMYRFANITIYLFTA